MDYQFSEMLGTVRSIVRQSDSAYLPLDMGNMDTRQFVADWQGGAVVHDAADSPVAYSEGAVTALGLTPL